MFTGDTFGLSYRELASPRGAFILPTTTPVQFEPEALLASIDRLVGFGAGGDAPHALLARHRDRAAGRRPAPADRRARGARAAPRTARPDRAARLRAGVEELFLGWVRDHETPLPAERVRELLALDVELNAQGLEAWLDRDRRVVP